MLNLNRKIYPKNIKWIVVFTWRDLEVRDTAGTKIRSLHTEDKTNSNGFVRCGVKT